MKTEQLNETKIPVVRIVKSLEKYRGKILFPEKLAKANDMLEKVKLPEKKYVR